MKDRIILLAKKLKKLNLHVLVDIFAQDPQFHTNRRTFPLSIPLTDQQPIQGNILYKISRFIVLDHGAGVDSTRWMIKCLKFGIKKVDSVQLSLVER